MDWISTHTRLYGTNRYWKTANIIYLYYILKLNKRFFVLGRLVILELLEDNLKPHIVESFWALFWVGLVVCGEQVMLGVCSPLWGLSNAYLSTQNDQGMNEIRWSKLHPMKMEISESPTLKWRWDYYEFIKQSTIICSIVLVMCCSNIHVRIQHPREHAWVQIMSF